MCYIIVLVVKWCIEMLELDTFFVCNTVHFLSKEATCFVELIYLHYTALIVPFSRWTCTAS